MVSCEHLELSTFHPAAFIVSWLNFQTHRSWLMPQVNFSVVWKVLIRFLLCVQRRSSFFSVHVVSLQCSYMCIEITRKWFAVGAMLHTKK